MDDLIRRISFIYVFSCYCELLFIVQQSSHSSVLPELNGNFLLELNWRCYSTHVQRIITVVRAILENDGKVSARAYDT